MSDRIMLMTIMLRNYNHKIKGHFFLFLICFMHLIFARNMEHNSEFYFFLGHYFVSCAIKFLF